MRYHQGPALIPKREARGCEQGTGCFTDHALRPSRRAIMETGRPPDLFWVLDFVCQTLTVIGRGELVPPLVGAAGQLPTIPSEGRI